MNDPDFIRTLFTADCALIVERTGRVAWCNGLAADLLAIERGHLADPALAAVCGISTDDSGQEPLDLTKFPIESIWSGGSIGDVDVCIRNSRTGGDPLWFTVLVQPVFDDSGETVTAAMILGHDITSRRMALRSLQDANATLSALLQASPLPILSFGADGNISYWNRAAESVFGWKSQEVLGRPIPFVPPEKTAEHLQMRAHNSVGGLLVNREIRRVRKDGEPVDLSLSTAPILDKSGAVSGTICVYIDISERKKLEEQLWQSSRLEGLGVLAAGVAHDFNNLLTTMLGNASLAIADAAPESDQELALRNVIAACDRAAVLTSQMLAYSGKGRFHLERVELSALLRDMRALIEATLGDGVVASFELRDGLPSIECDPQQIQQVILNVLINAGEAITGYGEVTLRTSLAPPPLNTEPIPHVCLEILDTGCGMDPDTRARMFDPFFSTKFTGRGLGLAAVIGIVRGHHGTIEVESELGKGTCFRILLPAGE